jgi:Protein of unknown function (DUF559)
MYICDIAAFFVKTDISRMNMFYGADSRTSRTAVIPGKNMTLTEYDLGRTTEPIKFGIKVIRFTNDQIIFNIDSVIMKIHELITELAPL